MCTKIGSITVDSKQDVISFTGGNSFASQDVSPTKRTSSKDKAKPLAKDKEGRSSLNLAATTKPSSRGTLLPKSKTGEKGTITPKTLVNLDWLDLKLSAGNLSLECFNRYGQTFFYSGNEAYRLDLLPCGGQLYRSKADVFYGDSKLGTIEFDGIFENLAKTAKFHVENSAFYDEWANVCLGSIIENFAKSIGAEVLGVLRVDIALDGRQFEAFGWNVYHHDILPIRQSSMKGGHWATDKEHLTRVTTGFSYGSRSSGRMFRCYDKSLEISENSKHKTYILDYWKENNLDQEGGHVWRLEAELRSDFIKTVDFEFNWNKFYTILRKKYHFSNSAARQFAQCLKIEGIAAFTQACRENLELKKASETMAFLLKKAKKITYAKIVDVLEKCQGFDWGHLFDKKRLLSLFQVATKNYFEFVDMSVAEGTNNAAQRKKRFQRAKRIQVIDFTQVHTDSYQRRKIEKKPKTDRTAKIMIKQLALSAALSTESEPEKALNYAKAAGLVMDENGLQEYVMKKARFWVPQIQREAWRRGVAVNSMVNLGNLATSLIDLQNIYV